MRDSHSSLPVALRLTQLVVCLSAAFALDHDAFAGTVTVCNDSGVAGTLRNVVAAAASGENISVSQCSLITLTNGEIASSLSKLRITGSSASPTVISGNNASRVINHTGSGGYLLLRDVTIQAGNRTASSAYGGCIYSSAPIVSLDHMTLQNCNATETAAGGFAKGGGLFALHYVDMRNSTVTGNTATQQSANTFKAMGGGVYAETLSAFNSTITLNDTKSTGGGSTNKYTEAGGVFTISSAGIYASTIANNYAGKYGAMFLASNGTGGVTIANSTISSNSALHHTGGIRVNSASFVLANSTVAFNYSLEAAGTAGVVANGGITLQSSIIAKNTFFNAAESDLSAGSINAASANNLIITSNIATPADTITADPHLLPLANNGGYTQTHALRQDSPALNRGNNVFEFSNFTSPTCDQRGNQNVPQLNPPNTDNCNMVNGGFLRVDSDPSHSLPDIGAYEEQLPNADWIFYDGLEGNYH
jgi:hypothetical protein